MVYLLSLLLWYFFRTGNLSKWTRRTQILTWLETGCSRWVRELRSLMFQYSTVWPFQERFYKVQKLKLSKESGNLNMHFELISSNFDFWVYIFKSKNLAQTIDMKEIQSWHKVNVNPLNTTVSYTENTVLSNQLTFFIMLSISYSQGEWRLHS